jgi:hypothetical protein
MSHHSIKPAYQKLREDTEIALLARFVMNRRFTMRQILSIALAFSLLISCRDKDACTIGDDKTCDAGSICVANEKGDSVCVEGCVIGPDDNCPDNQICEEIDGAEPDCVPNIIFKGRIFDSLSGAAVDGALVAAVDENGAAASDVVATDINGDYSLEVFSKRNLDGTPQQTFTLRASAQDFQDFPFGLRPALPISSTQAILQDGVFLLSVTQNAAVDIALLLLPANQQGFPSISGNAEVGARRGVLVVAESNAVGHSTLTDIDGDYTIFNVPPNATYAVNAFAAGAEYLAQSVNLGADNANDVDLSLDEAPSLTDLSGDVNIVNAPGGSQTSVVMVIESTFDELTGRGQVPPGLRAPESGPPSVTGAYNILGVPDGNYVVLAAFENDGLVRDPDPNISGTQTLHIRVENGVITDTVNNQTLGSLPNFKVTEALEIFSPGAQDQPELVSTPTPDLTWADDSSEDEYQVEVFDAFGTLVFNTTIPGVSGGDPVVTYAGDPLQEGIFYQFRATSLKNGGPISRTEDLRGVFFFPVGQ